MRGFAEKAPPTDGRCLWCGGRLGEYGGIEGRGYLGRGWFCTQSCGFQFGCRLAELGRRLKPTESDR